MRRMGCAKVTVVVRDKSRATSFIQEMTRACEAVQIELRSLRECGGIRTSIDLVFNATPAGSLGQPFPSEVLRLVDSGTIVFDALYRPVETELIQWAKEMGCRGLYGYEMLLGQGSAAFKLWTGKEPPVRAMKDALLRQLGVMGE
jgi:shikimate dehydrogenase